MENRYSDLSTNLRHLKTCCIPAQTSLFGACRVSSSLFLLRCLTVRLDASLLSELAARYPIDNAHIQWQWYLTISDYNNTMGGVDLCIQEMSYYPTTRKQQGKYYIKNFRQFLDKSLWNAYALYKKQNPT